MNYQKIELKLRNRFSKKLRPKNGFSSTGHCHYRCPVGMLKKCSIRTGKVVQCELCLVWKNEHMSFQLTQTFRKMLTTGIIGVQEPRKRWGRIRFIASNEMRVCPIDTMSIRPRFQELANNQKVRASNRNSRNQKQKANRGSQWAVAGAKIRSLFHGNSEWMNWSRMWKLKSD